jgi:hypothetical protein
LEYDEIEKLPGCHFASEGGHVAFTVEFVIGQPGSDCGQFSSIFFGAIPKLIKRPYGLWGPSPTRTAPFQNIPCQATAFLLSHHWMKTLEKRFYWL